MNFAETEIETPLESLRYARGSGWRTYAERLVDLVYAVAVLVLLGCYFLDVPPDRWEFYRHVMAGVSRLWSGP